MQSLEQTEVLHKATGASGPWTATAWTESVTAEFVRVFMQSTFSCKEIVNECKIKWARRDLRASRNKWISQKPTKGNYYLQTLEGLHPQAETSNPINSQIYLAGSESFILWDSKHLQASSHCVLSETLFWALNMHLILHKILGFCWYAYRHWKW